MKDIADQGELFGLVLQRRYPFRLRANDVIRVDGKLGWVIRVNECAAVVLMNRPIREFSTRFDKRVRIGHPAPTAESGRGSRGRSPVARRWLLRAGKIRWAPSIDPQGGRTD